MACNSVQLIYATVGATVPPKVTEAECVKPVPVIVTVVPPAVGPALGPTPLIVNEELVLLGLLPKNAIEPARMKIKGRERYQNLPRLGPEINRMSFVAGLAAISMLFIACVTNAATATVNWNNTQQVIDGFGAAVTQADLTPAQADLFFLQPNGIGLSLLRLGVPYWAGQSPWNCETIKLAAARSAKALATGWTPPKELKTNGSYINGGYLLSQYYQSYANFQTDYVKNVKAQCGVDLYALSVQNEPNLDVSYASADWSGQTFHDYILNNLGPTIAANGITTKIMVPENSRWGFSLADITLNDPNAAKYVGVLATHNYCGMPAPYPLGQNQGKHLCQTEVSDFSASDTSIGNALGYATKIHNTMVNANANAWHYGWAVSGNNDNEGRAVKDGTPTKRVYIMGNFSKFVRPGWYRVDATAAPAGKVLASAYKDPSTLKCAVVAVNSNSADTSLSFSVSGYTASSVTPWITDSSRDLVQQSPISAGSGFTYTLPANSAVTFVGTSGSTSGGTTADTAVPPQPTNLTATAISTSQINLSWSASTHNVGVTGYRVYRNGTQIATTPEISYSNTGVSDGTTYTYAVAAYDAAGNVSAQSISVSATTQSSSSGGGSTGSNSSLWSLGYYASWMASQYPVSAIEWSGLTHIAMAFYMPNSNGALTLMGSGDSRLARDLVAAAHAHGVKAIASLGGADSATAFRQATMSGMRDTFVNNIISLMDTFGYDGIDVDWEPLAKADEAIAIDIANRVHAARPGATVTIPVGSLNPKLGTDISGFPAIAAAFDQVNIMSYGMAGTWPGWKSWHSSALYKQDPATPLAVDTSVAMYAAAGVPKAKLGIGIGFFGLCYSAPVTGPVQALNGSTILGGDQTMSFANIKNSYYLSSARHWDSFARVPYLSYSSPYGPLRCTYISYDDEQSVAEKIAYVKAQRLGGVMMWQINEGYMALAPSGQRNPLLAAVASAIRTARPAPVADTASPSQPVNLSAAAVSASQISLSWSASSDNVGVSQATGSAGTAPRLPRLGEPHTATPDFPPEPPTPTP